MAANPMLFFKVSGTHREVGQQIGECLKPQLQRIASWMRSSLPPGVTWEDMLIKGQLCLTHSRSVYPQYVEELEGIAEGADLPFEEMFLSLCEELWESAAWPGVSPPLTQIAAMLTGTSPLLRGCTDLAARGEATVDGSTLIAHTNDTSPEAEAYLAILQVQAGDEPEFLGVTIGGLGFSAGFNAAGISMTGNAVSCRDIRPGVPRLLMARAILGATWLGQAINACLIPLRASNYNNVIADANGEVYSMEGSATDCEPIYIEHNILAHSNHYVSWPMRPFEANPHLIGNSTFRYHRSRRLLRDNYGHLSPEIMQKIMADHANYPGSICKHDSASTTVFSIVINLNERKAWIGRGRPCQTTYYEYSLEPWTPPKGWPKEEPTTSLYQPPKVPRTQRAARPKRKV
jgi:isopenicillin-N N-acyltransferase-like protein